MGSGSATTLGFAIASCARPALSSNGRRLRAIIGLFRVSRGTVSERVPANGIPGSQPALVHPHRTALPPSEYLLFNNKIAYPTNARLATPNQGPHKVAETRPDLAEVDEAEEDEIELVVGVTIRRKRLSRPKKRSTSLRQRQGLRLEDQNGLR